MNIKLDGMGLFVEDMPTMVRFYRDVMGFEIKEPREFNRDRSFCRIGAA